MPLGKKGLSYKSLRAPLSFRLLGTMRRNAVDLTRHLARRPATSFLDVIPSFAETRIPLAAPAAGVRLASDDARRSSGSSTGSAWTRKHKCRFAEHDVQVMHSYTNRGIEVLLNPIYNKGTGFSIAEKERLGVRGLTPPRYFSIEEQCAKIWCVPGTLLESTLCLTSLPSPFRTSLVIIRGEVR